ncbi:MAG: 2-oxoacid:acceptor oxidoreductase family protein, partial [Candidatus Pacebacteria bacterium]|nr:2-oxoacid:acceptor oxidoreductase family protein [Candidatus Paceibacterota bacterium]
MKNIYQIRIHSRGGQGAKTAAQIIAEASIEEGEFAQAFSEYGPERSGAPMKTFLRISKKPINLYSDVRTPDMVVVLDPSLLLNVDVTEGLADGGIVIVNTCKDIESLKKELSKKDCKIYTIDAKGIAMRIIGRDLPNTAIMGSIIKLVPLIPYEHAIEETREKFEKKLSEEMVEKNVEALKEGY